MMVSDVAFRYYKCVVCDMVELVTPTEVAPERCYNCDGHVREMFRDLP